MCKTSESRNIVIYRVCDYFNIKMLTMKVISQLIKTPCIHKDFWIKTLLVNEASIFRFINTFQTKGANIGSATVRYYSDKPFVSRIKDTSEEGKKQKESEKKKRDFIPKITLLDQKDNVSVTTMADASKLATRRGMKIVYLRDDPKSGRSEYKLVSNAEYLKSSLHSEALEVEPEEKSKDKNIKKEKLAKISSKIAEHDFSSKLKQIQKWLDKRHEIRVALTFESGGSTAAENMYKKFEEEFKSNGRLRQKVVTPESLKFIILPLKQTDESSKEKKENKVKGKVESKIEKKDVESS